MKEDEDKRSNLKPKVPSYIPIEYINHLPRAERRDRAKKIIYKWCRVHRKDRENGLAEAYEKIKNEYNIITEVLDSIEEGWEERLIEHKKDINMSVMNILEDMEKLIKFSNRASLHSSIDSIDVDRESPFYDMVYVSNSIPELKYEVNSQLYYLDRLSDEVNSKFHDVPFEGESKKLIDRVNRYICDLNVMENLLYQLNVWGELRPMHLLNRITKRPKEISKESYSIIVALTKFLDKNENSGLTFSSKVKPSLHSFVEKEAGFYCSPSGFDYKVKKAFSQVDHLLPAVNVPEPETNVEWFFKQRPKIGQMHRHVRALLKTGEINVTQP